MFKLIGSWLRLLNSWANLAMVKSNQMLVDTQLDLIDKYRDELTKQDYYVPDDLTTLTSEEREELYKIIDDSIHEKIKQRYSKKR